MNGRKNLYVPTPAEQQRIIRVNRPQSPQSVILAGEVLDAKGTDDLLTLITANDVMGGNFLSRMNMDLRETKGWSYGVRGSINRVQHNVPYILSAPVQADKTGAAIAALQTQMKEFLGSRTEERR